MSEKVQSLYVRKLVFTLIIHCFWNTKLRFLFNIIDSGSRYLAKRMFGNIKHIFYGRFWTNCLIPFNPKTAGQFDNLTTPWFFKKCVFHKKVDPWFFVTFNFIINHIFPENLIEISQFVHKIWRFFSSILTIFIDFSDFFTFPCCKETNDVTM